MPDGIGSQLGAILPHKYDGYPVKKWNCASDRQFCYHDHLLKVGKLKLTHQFDIDLVIERLDGALQRF
jgi:hypothetical protein